jgi:hypothetical protein
MWISVLILTGIILIVWSLTKFVVTPHHKKIKQHEDTVQGN